MTERTASRPRPARRRPRIYHRVRSTEPGLAPGSVRVDPDAPQPTLRVLAYDGESIEEAVLERVDEVKDWQGRRDVVWINVVGLGDAAVLEQLGALFGVHRLVLEDVANVHQRPKLEDYGEQLYVVCRMPDPSHSFETLQISLIIGPGILITFEEREGDCLKAVRRRLRNGAGRIGQRGVDYLAYSVIDAIVDAFFPVLQEFEGRLEELEDSVMHRPEHDTIAKVYDAKREILSLRRVVWPLREMTMALMRDDSPLITDVTRVYLRDCHDHASALADTLENYLEASAGLLEVCLLLASHRMNEVMKVLTLIATIFIPLTFIAGVYGMNFDRRSPWNMPELGWDLGYPLCLAVMVAIAVALLLYFRHLGWIGRKKAALL